MDELTLIRDQLVSNSKFLWLLPPDPWDIATIQQELEESVSSSSNQERDIGYLPEASFLPDWSEPTYRDCCIRAYQEVMRVAKDRGIDLPPQSSSPIKAPTFRKTVMSYIIVVIPKAASDMVCMMMNVKQWERSFLHMIHGSAEFDTDNALEYLQKEDAQITKVVGVLTKVQLPTSFVPMWDFGFLRYLKEIGNGIYVIIDVSSNFFDPYPKTNARLAGVIIRDVGDQRSEVTWLESVFVRKPNETIYSSLVKSRGYNILLPFKAGRWVDTLQWKLNRDKSAFLERNMDLQEGAGLNLLEIAHSMKLFYKACVAKDPDKNKFEVYTCGEDGARLMEIKAENGSDLGVCICTTSFHIKNKSPFDVFPFLVKKNLQLMFSSLPNSKEPELMLKFATDDYFGGNSITLHRKKTGKHYKYCLQEASMDMCCSFVISTPVNQDEVDRYIASGPQSLMYDPNEGKLRNTAVSGFAIVPDGEGDFHSKGSLVTFVTQVDRHPMFDFIESVKAVIEGINKTAGQESSSPSCMPFLTCWGNDGS